VIPSKANRKQPRDHDKQGPSRNQGDHAALAQVRSARWSRRGANLLLQVRQEFSTLRMRLIKIAARIVETASRVRVAFAAAHPEAALFASLARCLQPAGP
jgi:hypothetical protein